ncbi:hypothetical protein GCM10009771_20720 [Nesterenkonia flava]
MSPSWSENRAYLNAETAEPAVLLVSEDSAVVEDLALLTAVVGARLEHHRTWSEARRRRTADQHDPAPRGGCAAVICTPEALPLPDAPVVEPGREVLLVGRETALLWQAAATSAQLRPVPLPEGEAWLGEHLSTVVLARGSGRIVAVAGSCGGIGATTISYLLGAEAAARGLRVLLMDGTSGTGSGVQSLLAEARAAHEAEGGVLDWRQLSSTEGEISPAHLYEAVPCVDGIHLLCPDASSQTEEFDSSASALPVALPEPALTARALEAGRRAFDVVVLDVGVRAEALPPLKDLLDHLLLVTRASARGAESARQVARRCPGLPQSLVVNRRWAPGHSAAETATAAGLQLAADLPEQRWLARDDELRSAYELLRSHRGERLIAGLLMEAGVSAGA